MLNVLVLSDFDSRIKWGLAAALKMTVANRITLVMEKSQKKKVTLYTKHLSNIFYLDPLEYLKKFSILDYDVVIFALGGWMNVKAVSFLHQIIHKEEKRPLLIGGVNGLVDRSDPDVALSRAGLDVLLLNCKSDCDFFKKMFSEFGIDPPVIVEAGYLRIYSPKQLQINQRNTVLFVQQDGVPASKKAYIYLIKHLVDFAEKNKNNKVIIKLRNSGSSGINSNAMKYNALYLAKKELNSRGGVSNIEISTLDLEILLEKCDEVWSISSTAIIEGLMLNKKVFCISDFGISKKNGNTPFVGSKLFVTLENINDRNRILVDEFWKNNNVSDPLVKELFEGFIGNEITCMKLNKYKFKSQFYLNSPWIDTSNSPRPLVKLGMLLRPWFSGKAWLWDLFKIRRRL